MKKIKKKDWPYWVENALQGITYWIGHRRCMYKDYPLTEGAIVAELCNLIHAKLDSHQHLKCEVPLKTLLGGYEKPTVLLERSRADLVVTEGEAGTEGKPRFVIEVKRATASKAEIDKDLGRLWKAKKKNPAIRAFLFIISEAKRHKRFVNDEGHSIVTDRRIPE